MEQAALPAAAPIDPRDSSNAYSSARHNAQSQTNPSRPSKPKSSTTSRRKTNDVTPEDDASKRRCISSACVACRKRKSKCDGNLPACAACSQVYGTECIYDPNSDHRRKGVYRSGSGDGVKATRESTLQALVQALVNFEEDEAMELLREMRGAESLDAVAEKVVAREGDAVGGMGSRTEGGRVVDSASVLDKHVYGKMGDLRLDDGSVRYIGGTSNLIHITQDDDGEEADQYVQQEDPITSWTTVTDDPELVVHLLNMYFTWHYTYFTTLSKTLFYRDFMLGRPPSNAKRKTYYCSPLLVNAMLALGCHFTSHRGGRADPDDSATAGDHFFREAKRLILENDEHEKPRLTTVQSLALMSVREAGCGREAKGWVYSGMSFRMGLDMGLNLDTGRLTKNKHVNGNDAEEDVRRITFWGCYLFDKCWSNYLGRLPQIPTSIITAPKAEVFPDEDAANWSPYSDSGYTHAHAQPARTRAVALQITKLCEISNDLMEYFYNPSNIEKGRSKAAELKMLSDIHRRLETWRNELPKELAPKEGGLSSVLTMHMFFHILYIHLFRPFLQYTKDTSPLPDSVSPRKLCTTAASTISKLMRLYKRSYGLRQICNICVYIVHSACTIHLLNLPEKGAKRDIVHGVKHLEEIAEGWLCARRSLGMIFVLARKWRVELPEDAVAVLSRAERKFGGYDAPSPRASGHQFEAIGAVKQRQSGADLAGGVAHGPAMVHSLPASTAATTNLAQQHAYPPRSIDEAFHTTAFDANGFPSSQQYSAPQPYTMAPSQTAGYHNNSSSPGTAAAAAAPTVASPTAMFGGVEQLLHESNDWTYRDQAQLATGFENWDVSPAVWRSAPPNHVPGQTTTAAGWHASGSGGGGGLTANVFPPPAVEQFQRMGGGYVPGYNEEEWYQ